MNFSKKNIIIVVIIALCIAVVGLAIEKIINEKQYEESIEQQEENTREEKEKDEINETETLEVDDSEEESIEQTSTGNKIYVYVAGEVNNKGVVILNEGSRIVDQTTPNMIQRISGVFERKPLISRGIIAFSKL